MANNSLELAIKRIAQEDKATKALIQSLESKVGPLANLPTTAKASIVLALIEIHGILSTKLTVSDVATAFGATKDEILNGAAASVDTLKELADLWASQSEEMGELVTELGGILSFTESQNLTPEQQALVLQNVGAISQQAFTLLTGRVADLETDLADQSNAASDRAAALLSLIEAKSALETQQGKSLKVDADMGNTEGEQQQGRDNLSIASATAVEQLSQQVQDDVVDTTDYLSVFTNELNVTPTPTPTMTASYYDASGVIGGGNLADSNYSVDAVRTTLGNGTPIIQLTVTQLFSSGKTAITHSFNTSGQYSASVPFNKLYQQNGVAVDPNLPQTVMVLPVSYGTPGVYYFKLSEVNTQLSSVTFYYQLQTASGAEPGSIVKTV